MSDQDAMSAMAAAGLHPLFPEWQARKGSNPPIEYSTTFKECTVKCHGTDETITYPVQTCTKVGDLKDALAKHLEVNKMDLVFIRKQGCTWLQVADHMECTSSLTVKGVRTFTIQHHVWPHPIAIIGCGLNGIKAAMMFMQDNNPNFVCVDRLSEVGGHCWHHVANKTSKLQNDFGAFHLWWGPEYQNSKKCEGWLANQAVWPSKDSVLGHFKHAVEEFGVLPHCSLGSDVTLISNLDAANELSAGYSLKIKKQKGGDESYSFQEITCSCIFSFPGRLMRNRVVALNGESTFEGRVGYGLLGGLLDEEPVLKGSRVAIIGNGATAYENVRTCCELGSEMVYVVARRRSLPITRMACWFVDQAPTQVPLSSLLSVLQPAYEIAGLGEAWQYPVVRAASSKDRFASISQPSGRRSPTAASSA